ncbi:unnamed protein product [Heterotrigona itama]|uniref:Uncharacterized protein n=1 Tax=Heterotrigona itama TaxID=395501 RepID=A0A6V7HAY0_9HYME|nr:unnamed protein product [Heterotrigona itama]
MSARFFEDFLPQQGLCKCVCQFRRAKQMWIASPYSQTATLPSVTETTKYVRDVEVSTSIKEHKCNESEMPTLLK